MRVAQVLLSPRIGGAETLVDGLAAEWRATGIDTRTLYVDESAISRSPIARVRHLRRAVNEFSPSIIIAHSALPNLYARLAAPRRIPVLTVLHSASRDFDDHRLRRAERLLRHRTAAVIAVSEAQRTEYQSHFGADSPVEVVSNGVSVDADVKTTRAEVPARVLTMCRASLQKNPALWSETARQCETSGIGLRFEWFGPESDALAVEILHAAATTLASASYRGPTTVPLSELRTADLLFHPADREAQSIVLLEAAAVGLPVVCAAHLDEALPVPVASATFRAGDAKSAADALARVVSTWPTTADRALSRAAEIRAAYDIRSTAHRYSELMMRVGRQAPSSRPKQTGAAI